MEEFIRGGPHQLRQAAKQVAQQPETAVSITDACLLGMGGSALAAGLIELLRSHQQAAWPWFVARDYTLPALPHSASRVFVFSYSGNTEEVLTMLESVTSSGAEILCVSAGGRLAEMARQHDLPWIQVPAQPPGFQPRFALYFMYGVARETLRRDGLLEMDEPLDEVACSLESCELSSTGRELARWLGGRLPVIYSPTCYEAGVARTWRIKVNENTKRPALSGALPESNHNELIAFSDQYKELFAFLLLEDPDSPPAVRNRFQLFGEQMKETGYAVREVPLEGASPEEKALRSLMLADWVTFHAAGIAGIDPVTIPAIQDFKKRLSQ